MSKAYEKCPEGFMTVKEVEEFLGVTYQVFRKDLTPSNFDYSSCTPGMPKNLYRKGDVIAYDELYHYSVNKDRYNTNQVAKILDRSPQWVKDEIKPTDQIVRGERTYSFYDKKLIQQYLDTKNGIIFKDESEYLNKIRILENKVKELEEKLNNREVEISISDVFKVLETSDFKFKVKGN